MDTKNIRFVAWFLYYIKPSQVPGFRIPEYSNLRFWKYCLKDIFLKIYQELPIQINDFKDYEKSPGTALNTVHAVLLKKSFELSVVLRKDALHLVQVHLHVEILSEYI